MYLAVEIGTVDINPVFRGAVATILYFLVGMAVWVREFEGRGGKSLAAA